MTQKENSPSSRGRRIVLTFDDGPSPRTTWALLDILRKNQIRAMFFVLGSRLESASGPAIVERAHNDGHIIGNHSFSHIRMRELPKIEIKEELERTHELIGKYAGRCRYFRPPYGDDGTTIRSVTDDLGYKVVSWNVDSLDWKLKEGGRWVDHTIVQISNNQDSIVLMHDIYSSTVGNIDNLIYRIRQTPRARIVAYDEITHPQLEAH